MAYRTRPSGRVNSSSVTRAWEARRAGGHETVHDHLALVRGEHLHQHAADQALGLQADLIEERLIGIHHAALHVTLEDAGDRGLHQGSDSGLRTRPAAPCAWRPPPPGCALARRSAHTDRRSRSRWRHGGEGESRFTSSSVYGTSVLNRRTVITPIVRWRMSNGTRASTSGSFSAVPGMWTAIGKPVGSLTSMGLPVWNTVPVRPRPGVKCTAINASLSGCRATTQRSTPWCGSNRWMRDPSDLSRALACSAIRLRTVWSSSEAEMDRRSESGPGTPRPGAWPACTGERSRWRSRVRGERGQQMDVIRAVGHVLAEAQDGHHPIGRSRNSSGTRASTSGSSSGSGNVTALGSRAGR